jgi:hypothetical protein
MIQVYNGVGGHNRDVQKNLTQAGDYGLNIFSGFIFIYLRGEPDRFFPCISAVPPYAIIHLNHSNIYNYMS